MKGIILRGHNGGCTALGMVVDGVWDHPWAMPSSKFLPRDKKGRKRARRQKLWLVWECNDPDCEAQLGFPVEYVEEVLGLKGTPQ